jgi:hypothetical protein
MREADFFRRKKTKGEKNYPFVNLAVDTSPDKGR